MRNGRIEVWTLRCDGGSRGNPGPGAFGFVLSDPEGKEREARGGLEPGDQRPVLRDVVRHGAEILAARHGARAVCVVMDSELVVRQMTGEYKVKNEGLKPLHKEARQKAMGFEEVTYRSVGREDNERADRLVNETLDKVLGTESPR